MTFDDFVAKRWSEVENRLGFEPGHFEVSWEIKDGYPHFKKKRGYAVCFYNPDGSCHMQYSPKILKAEFHRADALVRHELGHVVDFLVPKRDLNLWALRLGLQLPSTPERRADALAYLIWGTLLKYDEDLVQSTKVGVHPRPEHLGL